MFQHNDREFVLKFSAIEIYNECVKDLLSSDGTQLRLLDDLEVRIVISQLNSFNQNVLKLFMACSFRKGHL